MTGFYRDKTTNIGYAFWGLLDHDERSDYRPDGKDLGPVRRWVLRLIHLLFLCSAAVGTGCCLTHSAPGSASLSSPAPGKTSASHFAVVRSTPTVPTDAEVSPMITIPGGTFQMGAPNPIPLNPDDAIVHTESVASFSIDLTEVSRYSYEECVYQDVCTMPDDCGGGTWGVLGEGNRPVNCVDWKQAQTYCAWVGKRLPTEQEWEYAARGPNSRVYPWGDQAERGESACLLERRPCAVGGSSDDTSAFGVKDMGGNVMEWTSSRYCPYDAPNCPSVKRVARGSSFAMARTPLADRHALEPDSTDMMTGFRCAKSL